MWAPYSIWRRTCYNAQNTMCGLEIGRYFTCSNRPLQDIRLLQSFLALITHPGIASPTCIAHTIAIPLHDFCAIYDPSPAVLSNAIHHTILVTAISCNGQVLTPRVDRRLGQLDLLLARGELVIASDGERAILIRLLCVSWRRVLWAVDASHRSWYMRCYFLRPLITADPLDQWFGPQSYS